MHFLLFGTGDYYNRFKKWFPRENVLALLDNSPVMQYTIVDGIKVLPPSEGIKLDYDSIVILSFYIKEMRQQLLGLGVEERRIMHFYDLHWLIYNDLVKKDIQYYACADEMILSDNKEHNRILLLSHDLELGGPALAVFHAAKVLKHNGYQLVVASMLDGLLRDKLLQETIPVVVDVNLQIETMVNVEWIRNFDFIICNTINYHVFLTERVSKIPVLWWLHDSEFFYHGVRQEVMRLIHTDHLTVCSVGNVSAQAIHAFLPKLPVKELLYGVEDTVCGKDDMMHSDEVQDKFRFVTIGYIENRKGQDILIQAVRLLPEELRRKAEFYLVGQKSSMFAGKLLEQTRDMTEIFFTGTMDRQCINDVLRKADVMLCPSREDPMPTVCAEAMMHSVPCILSDATGTAAYVEDGISGLVFQSENAQELSEKMKWCMSHRKQVRKMGEESRKVYETHFSMDIFEKNLLEIVEAGNG